MHGNTEQLRKINTDTVRGLLKQRAQGCTKAEVAAATGLSYATCNTLLNQLVQSGEALRLAQARGGGGRPATLYAYNGDYGHILCLHLTNDNRRPAATYTVYNLLGKPLATGAQKYARIAPGNIAALLCSLLRQHPKIRAVSLGVPGVVVGGRQVSICDLEGLANLPLGDILQENLPVPITLENDMNAIALGCHAVKGLPKESPSAALIYIEGNCPGCGLMVGGQLVRGATHFAGEVSYLPGGMGRTPLSQKNIKTGALVQAVAGTIVTLAAVVNPAQVMLCGSLLSADMLGEIKNRCLQALPAQNLPHIFFEADVNQYYMRGLLQLAQERIAYPLQITQKQTF